MYKLAQERGVLDWLSEKTDVGGIATESAPFLNQPGFKDLMDKLRMTDDNARSIALGKSVGEGEAPADSTSMKDLLKEAESSFNRREYMRAAAFLGRFHRKFEDIINVLKNFNADVSSIHEKFILEGLDPETQEQIFKMREKMHPKTASFNKEASIRDFFVNIFTDRGRALSAWEKRYPEKAKVLKTKTADMLKNAKSTFDNLSKIFKEMSSARNKRLVEKYDAGITKLTSLYNKHDSAFRDYYANYIKSFADKLAEQAEKAKAEQAKKLETELPKSEKPVSEKEPSKAEVPELVVPVKLGPTSSERETGILPPPSSSSAPTAVSPLKPFEISLSPKAESVREVITPQSGQLSAFMPSKLPSPSAPPTIPGGVSTLQTGEEPETEKDTEREERSTLITGLSPAKKAALLNSLISLGSESPLLLKSYLSKYANLVKNEDPRLAKSLFEIVSRIEG